MNGRILVAKPLYVALAQRKDERRAHLAAQYMQRMSGLRVQAVSTTFFVQQVLELGKNHRHELKAGWQISKS